MPSTFERTEPSFRPAAPRGAQDTTSAAPGGGDQRDARVWPWAAAALCAALFAIPSALAVPERLAADAQRAAAQRSAALPAMTSTVSPGPVSGPAGEDLLVTGSIAASSAMPAPQTALRLFGVRLAGGESADMLWTHWSELRARFPGVLDGIGTAVRPLPGPASPQRFELMAGRFRNAAEAASLCGRLRAHDIACAVKDLEEIPAAPPA